jgi:hypothetical protein
VSLHCGFPALFSDATTLFSGHYCEPNSRLVGAILVVFAADPFVNVVCEETIAVNELSIHLVISNEVK